MPRSVRSLPALGWKCPQCTSRSLSISSRLLAVGPEHPRYIDVPQPPQQTLPYRPPIKGILPVPRNVFKGVDPAKSDDERVALATKNAVRVKAPPKGSREEWKVKMSEIRKQNLREGVGSLRARQQREKRRADDTSAAKQKYREELLYKPEREDERLTAPSTNLDLEALYSGSSPDPNRIQRVLLKKQNIEKHEETKKAERMDAMHTLYMNAREFIVTPQQLDDAVEKAFGTDERPVHFGYDMQSFAGGMRSNTRSIWALGRPERIQDMVNKSNGNSPTAAMGSTGYAEISNDRMRRLAEALTGGKMDKQSAQ